MISTLKKRVYSYIIVSLLYLFICFTFTSNSDHGNCSSGEFILNGMLNCQTFLTCQDVKYMKPIKLIASGVVKNIWLVDWQHQNIVMSKLRNIHLNEDFNANLQNLIYFKGNRHVSNLLGHCGNTIFTEYYPLGNALTLHDLFVRYGIVSFKDRFQFCINYAQIIALLHQHSMVMCDSNSLTKALTQYLITSHYEIILNDLDALPRLNQLNVTKCGHRQIFGDLAAPEQKWPYSGNPYNDSLMPFYNEKVDIWKMPDICHFLLGDVPMPEIARKMLYFIHGRCKMIDHIYRPTAVDVVRFYYLINNFV